jgi:hypothetical protein
MDPPVAGMACELIDAAAQLCTGDLIPANSGDHQ